MAVSESGILQVEAPWGWILYFRLDQDFEEAADGFAKKLEAAAFTLAEGIEGLKPYLPVASQGRSTAPARFRNPANPIDTWSGRGRVPKWLVDIETQGRGREELHAV